MRPNKTFDLGFRCIYVNLSASLPSFLPNQITLTTDTDNNDNGHTISMQIILFCMILKYIGYVADDPVIVSARYRFVYSLVGCC